MKAGFEERTLRKRKLLPVFFALFRILRPKQWTKNLLLFAGLVFSQNLFHTPLLFKTLLAFGVFCLLSGSVYIFNDIRDLSEDRKHYKKRSRPLAAGQLSIRQAFFFFYIILAVSFYLAYTLGIPFFVTGVLYFLLVFGYSLCFKHIVILDVFAVALGFLLRAVAGGVVIGVSISPWLLICTLLLALFLALTKRRNEYLVLENNGTEHRRVLEDYSVAYLDQLVSIVTASTIMAYSLYTFTASGNEYLMISIPFVIYGIFRYLFLVHKKDMGGSPEDVLLKDKPLIVSILLWVAVCIAVIYLDGGGFF
ncbi:MAG: decaprenyl-phosphate phosphoribosyltransferase [Bacillota bacterium]|nr:decaprenyl-phosphate phosphoribosyltransferase [Bacillota bacterium]